MGEVPCGAKEPKAGVLAAFKSQEPDLGVEGQLVAGGNNRVDDAFLTGEELVSLVGNLDAVGLAEERDLSGVAS